MLIYVLVKKSIQEVRYREIGPERVRSGYNLAREEHFSWVKIRINGVQTEAAVVVREKHTVVCEKEQGKSQRITNRNKTRVQRMEVSKCKTVNRSRTYALN